MYLCKWSRRPRLPSNDSISDRLCEQLYGKRLEFFRETARKLANVGVLFPSSAVPFWEMIKKPLVEAAARLGITLSVAVVTGKADRAGYERVFDAMEKDQVDGLSVGENSENLANRVLIVELAARHRLPAIYPWREFVGKHNEEVQLYAFDVLALDGDDLRGLPLSMRKTKVGGMGYR